MSSNVSEYRVTRVSSRYIQALSQQQIHPDKSHLQRLRQLLMKYFPFYHPTEEISSLKERLRESQILIVEQEAEISSLQTRERLGRSFNSDNNLMTSSNESLYGEVSLRESLSPSGAGSPIMCQPSSPHDIKQGQDIDNDVDQYIEKKSFIILLSYIIYPFASCLPLLGFHLQRYSLSQSVLTKIVRHCPWLQEKDFLKHGNPFIKLILAFIKLRKEKIHTAVCVDAIFIAFQQADGYQKLRREFFFKRDKFLYFLREIPTEERSFSHSRWIKCLHLNKELNHHCIMKTARCAYTINNYFKKNKVQNQEADWFKDITAFAQEICRLASLIWLAKPILNLRAKEPLLDKIFLQYELPIFSQEEILNLENDFMSHYIQAIKKFSKHS